MSKTAKCAMSKVQGTLRLAIYPTETGAVLHTVTPSGSIFHQRHVAFGRRYDREISKSIEATQAMRNHFERIAVHDLRAEQLSP